MKKTIYKTKVTIEILSDEPVNDNISLKDIQYEITDGQWSGKITHGESKPLKGKPAVKEILNHGTDPEFFFMDDKGNEIEQ